MVGRRKYEDGCAIAQALDVIGERWALLVVRELVLGPKRFTDLLSGLQGVSSDVLTQRLRDLGEAGVVRRRRLGPPVSAWVYELTKWGTELEPIILELAHWLHRSPLMRYDLPLGPDSLMLSLKTRFDARAADGLTATIGLSFGDSHFDVRIADGHLEITRGDADNPDLVLDTDEASLLALLNPDGAIDDALASGRVRLTGDTALADRLKRVFPVPD
ncbi:putative transcriptional regulator [Mycobacterium sp. JS623]|uniref:winged helix-turn-helix transcriptional regulator n=1 Tax=Mycobacterium sp. JS623 TaxID=212767 RepID=UPI0002A5B5F7|nr:winged helix-turn-helix transcriptional regulator [Mycobacterium sp. JS623]AGB24393.1 putative transcriptional regulator [Mycobacterium sp. JS623]